RDRGDRRLRRQRRRRAGTVRPRHDPGRQRSTLPEVHRVHAPRARNAGRVRGCAELRGGREIRGCPFESSSCAASRAGEGGRPRRRRARRRGGRPGGQAHLGSAGVLDRRGRPRLVHVLVIPLLGGFPRGAKGAIEMIPASFDYHAPQTLEEAVALLQQHKDEAKVLSGGQSLLPLLKLRLGVAGHLVDIGRIPGLEYIKEEGGVLKIGGRTRESALERSDLVRTRYPLLADTAAVIADPLVRNLATVGGNLA